MPSVNVTIRMDKNDNKDFFDYDSYIKAGGKKNNKKGKERTATIKKVRFSLSPAHLVKGRPDFSFGAH